MLNQFDDQGPGCWPRILAQRLLGGRRNVFKGQFQSRSTEFASLWGGWLPSSDASWLTEADVNMQRDAQMCCNSCLDEMKRILIWIITDGWMR